jgi:hypothetical protein
MLIQKGLNYIFLGIGMDRLKQNIKEWVKLDEEMGELRKRMRALNQAKVALSEGLLSVMKDQKIDEFDLNNEGKLVRQTKKTKQPINKKQLIASLSKYYEDEKDAQKVTDFILNSRQERLSESICKK